MEWNWKKEGFTFFMILALLSGALLISSKKSPSSPTQKGSLASPEKGTSAKEGNLQKKMVGAIQERPGLAIFLFFLNVLAPLILALFFWIYFFFRWVDGEKWFSPPVVLSPRWNILDVFRVIFFFFFCQICILLFRREIELSWIPEEYARFLAGNFLSIATMLFLFFVVKIWSGSSFKDLGLHWESAYIQEQKESEGESPRKDMESEKSEIESLPLSEPPETRILLVPVKNSQRTALIRGGMAYFMIFPFILAATSLAQYLGNLYDIPFEPHPLVNFMDQGDWLELLYLCFVAVVLAPVVEEIFFRGFAYPALRKWMPSWVAMLFISTIFAMLHQGFHSFFPIFVLGMLLVYLYEKTGSLLPSIAVHSLHNGLTMITVVLLKEFIS